MEVIICSDFGAQKDKVCKPLSETTEYQTLHILYLFHDTLSMYVYVYIH